MLRLSMFARLAALLLLALGAASVTLSTVALVGGRYLGATLDESGRVLSVSSGGPADRAGLVRGIRVRSVAGILPGLLQPALLAPTFSRAALRADAAADLAALPGPAVVDLEGGGRILIDREGAPLAGGILAAAPVWLASGVFAGIGLLILVRGKPRRGFPVALALAFLAVPPEQLGSGAGLPDGLWIPFGLPLLLLHLAGHVLTLLAILILLVRYPTPESEKPARPRAAILSVVPGVLVLLWGLLQGNLSVVRLSGLVFGAVALGWFVVDVLDLDTAGRRRIRWLLGATAVLLPLSLIMEVPPVFGMEMPLPRTVMDLALAAIPAGFGLAVVEYRLFDLERLARGTLVWAVLSGGLALTFMAALAGLDELAPSAAASGTSLRVALAVLAALALRPAFELVQRFVDRLFFRSRFDNVLHLDHLAQQLARARELSEVEAAVDQLLDSTVRPESHELVPQPVAEANARLVRLRVEHGEALEVPLSAGDRLEGVLRLGPRWASIRYGRADRRLLASASVPIALALARLRAVRELEQANLALRRSLEELTDSQERLVRQERLAALGEMSSAVVHEIRHPLGIMGMGLHLLMRQAEKLPREAVQEVLRIQSAHSDCSEVIRVVQKVSKDLQVVGAPWRASDLLAESVSGMGDLAAERHIEVETTVAPDLPPVAADRRTLTQALGILLRNAVEASPDGARVRVSVGGVGPIRFAVVDEGPGVPERDRSRIFEPFFTTKPQGMGLGLAYARKVAQAHGGALILEPTDRGAQFVLTVPAWSGPDEALPARTVKGRVRSA